MWKCTTCENEFNLTALKDEVYVGYEEKGLSAIFGGDSRFDCVDCPHCSCQNVLNERYKKLGAPAAYNEDDEDDGEIVTETVTNAEACEKTRFEDCDGCWCNTCVNIEKCIDASEGEEIIGVRPYPCAYCADGWQYTQIVENEKCPCTGYVAGAVNND